MKKGAVMDYDFFKKKVFVREMPGGSSMDQEADRTNVLTADQALNFVRSIKPAEKPSAMHSMIDTLFRQKKTQAHMPRSEWFENACAEALTLPGREDRDRMLQRIAAAASRFGDASAAFEAASKIIDPETKAYALSSSILGLLTAGQRQAALQFLPAITDVGAREDAIAYIMKDLYSGGGFEETLRFIESLPNPSEKRQAAKTLMGVLTPIHDAKHIQDLKQRINV